MPPSRRILSGLVWLLLATSGAANAYLLTRSPEPGPRVVSVALDAGDMPVEDTSCAAELEVCRRASTGLALGLWGNAARAPASAPAAAPPPKELSTRDALCEIARDKLREQWLEKKDAITGALTMALADPARRREDAERDAKRAADTLGVTGRARRDFEEGFADARIARLQALAPLAQGSAMDWPGLLDGAHTVFGAEDAVVEKQLGAEGVARYEAAEMANRLTILSMLATYANADWNDAVTAP